MTARTTRTKLVSRAKEAGFVPFSSSTDTTSIDDFLILLGTRRFWCGNTKLHKDNPDYQQTARCCTTHMIGLPRHPATNEEMPLTPFQIEFALKIIDGREKFGDEIQQMRKPLLIHLNKGRQLGFTEIVLRVILHLSFTRYAGSNVGIIAATNGSLAKKDLRRLARLYKSIPVVVEQWIKNNTIRLVNGTVIEAFSASEEALTGDTKYKCIFMDEAAKWKLVDDSPVFNSILPIVRTNGADLLLVSTPKGPVKMFYQIEEDPQDFELHEYDIWNAKGNLYSEEEINKMLESSTEDPEQEYLCKYKVGKSAIFGGLDIKDQMGLKEWLVEDNEENDNYQETQEEEYDPSIHWHDEGDSPITDKVTKNALNQTQVKSNDVSVKSEIPFRLPQFTTEDQYYKLKENNPDWSIHQLRNMMETLSDQEFKKKQNDKTFKRY